MMCVNECVCACAEGGKKVSLNGDLKEIFFFHSFKKGAAEPQHWNWVKEMGEGECAYATIKTLTHREGPKKPTEAQGAIEGSTWKLKLLFYSQTVTIGSWKILK